MNLYSWARKWSIPKDAVDDLRLQMGLDPSQDIIRNVVAQNEADVQANERLQAARSGALLWRNNVGAMQDATGRVVRFGLANESKQMNKKIKSSDLIGITPIEILPQHIGKVIGQFTAIECKEPGWVFKATDHELAQRKFIELVISRGGSGCFKC